MPKPPKKNTPKVGAALDAIRLVLPGEACEGIFDQLSQTAKREVAEIDRNAASLNAEMKDALSFQTNAEDE